MAQPRLQLTGRLIQLAVGICSLTKHFPHSVLGDHVRAQLIRCSTAPFAHYSESQSAESARDYVHKVSLASKELREAQSWLRFACQADLVDPKMARDADTACNELIAILTGCVKTARQKIRSSH